MVLLVGYKLEMTTLLVNQRFHMKNDPVMTFLPSLGLCP